METRKLKSGEVRYKVSVSIDRKRVSKVFKRKKDASNWRQRILTERDTSIAMGINLSQKITVEGLLTQFLRSKESMTLNSYNDYRGVIDKYIRPSFDRYDLKSITLSHIERFRFSLIDQKIGKARVNFILKVLKMIFKYAQLLSYIIQNPTNNLKLCRLEHRDITYWSLEECKQFLTLIEDDHYKYLYIIALNTGMRLGELLGLKWDAIDLSESRIAVKRTMTRAGLQETTKSKKVRYIPMTSLVKNCFEVLNTKSTIQSFVFTNPKGEQVSYEHFTFRIFNPLLKKLNMRKIRFHDLRTTFASNFCMTNGNIYSLSKLLGHSSVEITQKRYAFLNDQFLKDELSNFEIAPDNYTFSAPSKLRLLKTSENSAS